MEGGKTKGRIRPGMGIGTAADSTARLEALQGPPAPTK